MARRPNRAPSGDREEVDGFVVVDKPAGMTSHDVVARARRALATRRIGHAGTLDPGATGVLVLGVGRGTRLLRYVSGLAKTYRGEVVFGVTTSTLDDEGDITGQFNMSGLTTEHVRDVANRFVGTIEQTPPMVSAIKVDGRKLYELARAGVEIERAPRSVTITRLECVPTEDPLVYTLVVDCSSGTYVRSIAADLGSALGGGAHLRRLRREAVGPFGLDEAISLDLLSRADVRPSLGLVRHLDAVFVDDAVIGDIAHGKILERRFIEVVGEGPWALASKDARLLGVYEQWTPERIKPAVVLIEASRPVQPSAAEDPSPALHEDHPDGR